MGNMNRPHKIITWEFSFVMQCLQTPTAPPTLQHQITSMAVQSQPIPSHHGNYTVHKQASWKTFKTLFLTSTPRKKVIQNFIQCIFLVYVPGVQVIF